MGRQVTNFGRFYMAIRVMDPIGDRDEVKKSLVWQYTDGRTDSLREMTREEYDKCCADLERRYGHREELRRERSATLRLMQRMGVDTTEWDRVNALCLHTRIIGKEFARITPEEHRELRKKLRIIERKGGLRANPGEARKAPPAPRRKAASKPKTITFNINNITGIA